MQKMSSFSSDFQTLIKHYFLLCFLNELLMSLRNIDQVLAASNQVSMKCIVTLTSLICPTLCFTKISCPSACISRHGYIIQGIRL